MREPAEKGTGKEKEFSPPRKVLGECQALFTDRKLSFWAPFSLVSPALFSHEACHPTHLHNARAGADLPRGRPSPATRSTGSERPSCPLLPGPSLWAPRGGSGPLGPCLRQRGPTGVGSPQTRAARPSSVGAGRAAESRASLARVAFLGVLSFRETESVYLTKFHF